MITVVSAKRGGSVGDNEGFYMFYSSKCPRKIAFELYLLDDFNFGMFPRDHPKLANDMGKEPKVFNFPQNENNLVRA